MRLNKEVFSEDVVIETQGLSKTYRQGKRGAIEALLPLSVKVFRGEIVAILGLNGAGKTTFIKLLMGLIYPTGGKGKVLGKELGDRVIKSRIGYLPENHKYPPFLSAYNTLKMFAMLHNIDSDLAEKRVFEALNIVGLLKVKDTMVGKYSKGMKQRLAVAASILHNPDLLILDEPTDGLDPIGRKHIRELLLNLKNNNKTIMINSHILSEVEQICDRAIILNKGRLIKEGKLSDITNNFTGYNIYFVGLDLGSINRIKSVYNIEVVNENTIYLKDRDENTLNKLIKEIHLNNGLVIEIKKQQFRLEDIFIDSIS